MGLNNLFVCLSAQNIRTSFNNARVTALVASTQDVEKENLTRLFASERQLCYQAYCTPTFMLMRIIVLGRGPLRMRIPSIMFQ